MPEKQALPECNLRLCLQFNISSWTNASKMNHHDMIRERHIQRLRGPDGTLKKLNGIMTGPITARGSGEVVYATKKLRLYI